MGSKAKKRMLLHRYYAAINASCEWEADVICHIPFCSKCDRAKLGENAYIKTVKGKNYVACRHCHREAQKRDWDRKNGETVKKRRMPLPELVQWYIQQHGWHQCWLGHYKNPQNASIFWDARHMNVLRAIYQHFFGACVVKDLVLEHHWGPDEYGLKGCHNSECHNPLHVRIVTQGENALSGNSPSAINARKTHCNNNHPLHVLPDGRRTCGRANCSQLREYDNPNQILLFDLEPYVKEFVCAV